MNIYTYDGAEFSEDEIIAAAEESGMDVNSYINKVGIKKGGPGKKKPAAVTNAPVAGKNTASKSAQPSLDSSNNGFGRVKLFDPLNITKNNLRNTSNSTTKPDLIRENIQKWDKKNKPKADVYGPEDKDYGTLQVKDQSKIGDYLTSALRTKKANETLFGVEEEEGKKTLEKLYAGIPGLTFEETNKVGGDISNMFDAVKAIYIDPVTGDKKESDILQFDISAMNASAADRPKLANKNADILKDFFNKNLKDVNLAKNKALREQSKLLYNKELNNSITPEFKAEVNAKFDSPDLFTPVKRTYEGTAAGGGFAMGTGGGGSYVVKPYENELNFAKKQILAKNPKISKEDLAIQSEREARNILKANAINTKKADYAESLISQDKSLQSQLYVGSILSNEEAVKTQNRTTVKLKVAENNEVAMRSALQDGYSVMQGDVKTTAELEQVLKKFKNAGIDVDLSNNELVTLKNGVQVYKSFYDASLQLEQAYKANNLYATQVFEEQNNNLEKLQDSNIFSTAAAKNYDLNEKYLTNIGAGAADIAVGASYFTAKVLAATTPLAYAGDEVSKLIYGEDAQTTSGKLDEWAVNYTKAVDDIRQSYVRDIAFEDAFDSAGNFGKFAAQEISQQIPIIMAMAATGGAAGIAGVSGSGASTAMIGAFGAGGKMAEMQTEMAKGSADYSNAEIWLKSIGFGASEALFERATTIPILKRAKTHFASFGGEDVLDTSMKAYFKSKTPGFIYDQFLESAGETGTTITQNIIDGKPVMENVAHSAFSGFGMGTVISGVPYTHGLYLSAFSDYNSKQEIRSLNTELKDLGKQFELTKKRAPKKAIAKLMDAKQQEINVAIEKQQSKINENLRAGAAQSIIYIENEKAKLQNEAKSIVDDTSIESDLKEILIKDLRTKFNLLNNTKEKALNPINLMQDKSKFILLEASEPVRYNGLIDQATVNLSQKGNTTPEAVQKEAYELYLGQEIDININNAGKVEGVDLMAFDTKADAIIFINDNKDMSEEEKSIIKTEIQKGGDGFNVGNLSVVVKENMLANQRTQIGSHEVGHTVFNAIFKNNPEAFIPIANQILLTTEKLDKKLYKKLAKNTDKVGNKFDAQEVVSRFLESVSSGDISFAEKKNSFLSGLFGSMIQKEFIDQYDFDFKGQTDMFNFVVGLGKKIKEGTLTLKDIESASESSIAKTVVNTKDFKNVTLDNGEVSFSKTVEERIDDLYDSYAAQEISDEDFETQLAALEEEEANGPSIQAEPAKKELVKKEATEKEPRSKGNLQNLLDTKYEGDQKRLASEGLRNTSSGGTTNDFSKSIIGKELGGTIENITRRLYDPITADAKRSVTREEYKNALIQSAALLINNEFDASKQTLDKFISSRLNLRANALAYELGIEGATKGGIKKDVSEEKSLIAEETVSEAKEKPKYANALEAKVLSADALKAATNKIITQIRTLKSRIDAPISINRTVTPLISEIKDNIGKQLDIDIKTMLGGKKDGTLKKELLRNKRYILENMTTTWLMGKGKANKVEGGIPQAIQKQIDGKWVSYPDWVGKTPDRESVSTDQAGRTSGAEIVRRIPNVFNNVSDADFLGQIIGPDGNPIRGRKESVSKAMAEEIAFDIIKDDFENDGPLYEAFSANQERLGVELNDVLKTEFNKQSDRGNIKFSKAANKSSALFLLEEGGWVKDYAPFIEFYKGLPDDEKRSLNSFLNRTKSLIDRYNEVWLRNAGVRFERDVYSKIRKELNNTLKEAGLEVTDNIPDRFNRNKPDLVITDKASGNNIVIELKSSVKDPMGSSSNGDFINDNSEFTKSFTGIDILREKQKANTNRSKFINYLKKLISEGSPDVRLTKTGIQISEKLYKTLDRSGTETEATIPIQAISDINDNKKDILDIKGVGTFAFPGSSQNFEKSILPLKGNMIVSTEFRTNSASKGWRTIRERAYFYLDPKFDQKAGPGLDKSPEEFIKAVENANKEKIQFSKAISPTFNKIIEENKGVEDYKNFSDIVARRRGAGKNRFDIYVPASAADFELLLYNFMGEGQKGEEQKKFFTDTLLKPYANGNDLMDAARQSIKNEYKQLLTEFPTVAKKIEKRTPDGDFTYDQAIRVAMWNDEGVEIPGLSQRDTNKLTELVNSDPELKAFKEGLIITGRQGRGWVKPEEYWDANTIITDLHNLTEGEGRKKFLSEFIANAEEMFGKWENGKLVGPNINKVEAVYGTDVREALEDVLYRMTTGKNRGYGKDKETSAWANWVSGSTGAIMFLNVRSAALQLIGAVNFLNLRDNNPYAAAKAFANQKQYWEDFAHIWNSDKMKERRGGLKEDVAAAEIANAAAGSKNKVGAVLSYLLKIGYTPTQMADSFAIASGGAPFYRNRIKSYTKEGMSEREAEEAAWDDFTKVSDETQQSGDPRDISKQQASPAGRLLLTFQNTAMQQSRIVKKAVLDLKNGRGDAKTSFAKIAYYVAIQNTMFAVLQQGLFAVAFGDDDEDKEKSDKEKKLNDKLFDVADGVVDTILRGTGFVGGIVATVKNMAKKYLDEKDKKFKADYAKVVLEAANLSPPIGSKLRKLYSGLQQTKFDKDLIEARGWDVTQDGRVNLGPMYGVGGKLVESFTNVPADRLVTKINNASEALNSQNTAMQRIMVGLGWSPYSAGIEDSAGDKKIRSEAKAKRKIEGVEKARETRERTKDSIRNLPISERIKLKKAAALDRREKRRRRKMG